MRRADEGGASALLEAPEPVNRLPEFVRHVVQRLKGLCPTLGKKRIAQTLARAGLVLAVSTVGRLLKEGGSKQPKPGADADRAAQEGREGETTATKPVQARKPNDVWQIDLTLVPTAAGFWTAWIPFSIAQVWPFCWWVACVVDQYSRRVLGFEVFPKEPDSLAMEALLAATAAKTGAIPRYVVSDKGRQFESRGFRSWCERHGAQARYAAAESLHATAVIERFHRSFKDEWLRRIQVPLRRGQMRKEIACYFRWFEAHRPHQGLGGRTPSEVYAAPQLISTERPVIDRNCPLEMRVRFYEGRRQLPIVQLKPVA
jgi:putative transposase